MNWEDLKFYKTLKKEELTGAKKEIENIISENLTPFGFRKYRRKLIRPAADLFHVIHLDSRGSWMGASSSLKTEIAIVSACDVAVFIHNQQPISGLYINDIVPGIKNYYQITQEYRLFADFMSRTLISKVLPYFNQYPESKAILEYPVNYDSNSNLELLCELKNHTVINASEIIKHRIKRLSTAPKGFEIIGFWEQLSLHVENKEWKEIDAILESQQSDVLKKLKIRSPGS